MVPAACTTSNTDPGIPAADFGSIAAYSKTALAQGATCTGFRAYLSTGLPQYDSQSYEFFGHLTDDDGNVNSIALMSQGNPVEYDHIRLPFTAEEGGLIFNRLSLGEGPMFGGIYGVAGVTVPVSIDYQPWAINVADSATAPTQTIEMKVLSGRIGGVGAEYELTVAVKVEVPGSSTAQPAQLTIRAKDHTGMIQWGYGPNGFFPLWMFDGSSIDGIHKPDQRTPIMTTYGGDIGAYLAATNAPMTGQGSHYYSMPLVEVEEWSITVGSSYVAHGTEGNLFFDNLTETYNESAKYILEHGYSWTEFSVQLPDSTEGMLIARTHQDDVGDLYYAMRAGAGSTQSTNGTLEPTANWPQGAIHITAIPSSTWTSPASGYVYELSYSVQLDASSTEPAADLTFTAVAQNQELCFTVNHETRAVYEGLFEYSGTLDGKTVSGYAWGEIQGTPPGGGGAPTHC
ncbi:hypothetical protein GCM10009808_07420 [Microbacterium sediminicola]|uniref:Uncharacterized protein n=1 Tax=Microbacterium sediminicola TaxID=415210 RepID=A0ABP4TUU0_9MICO